MLFLALNEIIQCARLSITVSGSMTWCDQQ
jgi:hypothetical protein